MSSLLEQLQNQLSPAQQELLHESQHSTLKYAVQRVTDLRDREPGLTVDDVLRHLEADLARFEAEKLDEEEK
ncbi:hypothetical protein GCM10027591_03190 [Zhihengliuella somnathii]